MQELIEANWPVSAVVLGAAALLVLLAVWWLLVRSRRSAAPRSYKPDVLDVGQAPAQRNQALIDAPRAADIPVVPVERIAEPVAVAVVPVVPVEPVAAPTAEPKPKAKPKVPAKELVKPAVKAKPAKSRTAVEPAPAPPAPAPAPAPVLATASGADDLARIKGLGPKLQALLPQLGLSSFAQIAALSEADLAALDPKLGPFAGRPQRDGWVEQARLLAAGDVSGFEDRFGKV